VITHGLPRPLNIEIALEMESAVKENGAYPATIGIIDGTIHVGLSNNELELLGTDNTQQKISRRNFAGALLNNQFGSTTVSATMTIAMIAGVDVFTTCGICSVH